MSAISATAPEALKHKLTDVEQRIRSLREQRTAAVKGRDAARDAFARQPGYDTNSREFKAAQEAVNEVKRIDGLIEEAQASQVGMLKLVGGVGSAGGDMDVNHRDVERLKSRPGAFLSHVLDKRKHEVPHLREDVRMKAMTTDQVGLVEESAAFIDLLSPATVVLSSGVNVINITETSVKVPRFTTLPSASWTAERAALPLSDPGLQQVQSTPSKSGLVTVLSVEMFEDLTPQLLAGVQRQILRAVALSLDTGLLNGDGTAPNPRGILQTSGTLAIAGGLTNLSAFANAIGGLVAANSAPDTIIVNPADYRTLLGLTRAATSTDSNVPLLPAAGGQGFSVEYTPGVRWFISAGVPQGKALVYDSSAISVVMRHPADLSLDPYYGFQTGEVALRSYVRADVIVNQAAAVAVITFA